MCIIFSYFLHGCNAYRLLKFLLGELGGAMAHVAPPLATPLVSCYFTAAVIVCVVCVLLTFHVHCLLLMID